MSVGVAGPAGRRRSASRRPWRAVPVGPWEPVEDECRPGDAAEVDGFPGEPADPPDFLAGVGRAD
jgi:hypothetical protein